VFEYAEYTYQPASILWFEQAPLFRLTVTLLYYFVATSKVVKSDTKSNTVQRVKKSKNTIQNLDFSKTGAYLIKLLVVLNRRLAQLI
jgi:hypothetical protein